MTSPKPNPDNEPKEIRDFREKYNESLNRARVSQDHTATEGWQNLYCENRESIRKEQSDISDRIAGLNEALRQRLLTEDEEKSLGEIKKQLSDLRGRAESFQQMVIDPVIAPMSECASVVETARAAAREAERSAPLHTRGFIEKMETAIEEMPRVKFITGSGKLIVGD